MTTAAGMRKRWSIKKKAIDFSTTPYRSVRFRQFFGACLQSQEAVVGNRVNLQPGEIHLQCTARNTDGVEQRIDGHNRS